MRIILALLVMSVLLFGCTQPSGNTSNTQNISNTTTGTASAASTTVIIQGFAFSPAEITVKQGDTVKWINKDSAPHTVKFDSFVSSSLSNGDTFEHKFTEAPGEYSYICGIHTSMKGKITVTD